VVGRVWQRLLLLLLLLLGPQLLAPMGPQEASQQQEQQRPLWSQLQHLLLMPLVRGVSMPLQHLPSEVQPLVPLVGVLLHQASPALSPSLSRREGLGLALSLLLLLLLLVWLLLGMHLVLLLLLRLVQEVELQLELQLKLQPQLARVVLVVWQQQQDLRGEGLLMAGLLCLALRKLGLE